MAQAQHRPAFDPAADAAGLLRRLAFALLGLVMPVGALLSRRAVVVLFPMAVALLVAATIIDGAARSPRRSLRKLAASPAAVAVAVAIGWSLLSLAWSPVTSVAAERASGPSVTLLLGLAAYGALPDRMRSANLYLVTIGVGLAGVATLLLSSAALALDGETDRNLPRGVALVVVLVWPALAWLRSRARDGGAAILALLIAAAVAAGRDGAAAAALATGAMAWAVVFARPRSGIVAVAGVLAAVVLLAPLMVWLAPAALRVLGPAPAGLASTLDALRSTLTTDPSRLLTGHGLGSFLAGRLAGTLPASIPDSLPLQVWYDLGLVGAVSVGAALFAGLLGAARFGPLLPGVAGAVTAAFTLGALGTGGGQAWWPVALVTTGLLLAAAERGQYRTRRPAIAAVGPA